MITQAHWDRIGRNVHQGICLPLSALHTKNSCGIGEFLDLLPLIDWCASLPFDVIQLLPLFDTGEDPSPYNPLSSCALNPIYLSLHSLSRYPPKINASDRVDYARVKAQKLAWLQTHFQNNFKANDPNYLSFCKEQTWLPAYAAYKATQDGTTTDFHSYLQYLCFQQLKKAHDYAAAKKVFLKGDIPYLMNGHSIDVQESPHLFNQTLQAGAPPDYYNPNGQNWGCPLFNWEAMKGEGYRWWKRRMKAVLPYYDMYRIDHVVGLFRIWGIEQGKPPTEGSFVPADPTLWLEHGKTLLHMMIDASPLLPMAEDLGTIPPIVRICLKELGICSTKVIRWERNWSGDKQFIPFEQYEPISMTTCSTMDSDTLRGWWHKYPDESRAFADFMHWPYETELSSALQKQILEAAYHTPSLFHINLLQDLLALFPELVFEDAEANRINIPGTILPTNWTYRFKPSIEEIMEHEGLKKALREILG